MMFKTHLAFGVLMALLAVQILQPTNPWLFGLLIVIASSLPDIDTPDSKIGRKVKVIGWIFEHRGFFHSLAACFLFSVLTYAITKNTFYSIAFLIGYGSHLLMDSITKEGVMPFFPLRFRLRGFFRTGHLLEFVVFVGMVAVIVVFMKMRVF